MFLDFNVNENKMEHFETDGNCTSKEGVNEITFDVNNTIKEGTNLSCAIGQSNSERPILDSYTLSTEVNEKVISKEEKDSKSVVNISETCVAPFQEKNKPNEEAVDPQDIDHTDVKQCVSYNFSSFTFISECRKTFNIGNNFLKGCKWSPDGTCLLSSSDDNVLRLVDLPQVLYNKTSWDPSLSCQDELIPSLEVKEAGLVYDYAWYPFMTSWDPATSCFVSTCSKCPVHLWDAFTGKIRGSYRGYDNADEVTNAYSVTFNPTGDKILCGYKNEIKIFDVSKPGRDYASIHVKALANQRGIISCIDCNPTMPTLFAAGSYNKSIGLYTAEKCFVCLLLGHRAGLTQVKFSSDGSRVFSSARHDGEILCWDLRNPGSTLFSLRRPHDTNQRVYFDISPDGQYLISGSTDGIIRVWELSKNLSESSKPDFQYSAHKDCANGISLHRQYPILATSSGQRHFPDLNSDQEDEASIFLMDSLKTKMENSIKLWWIGNK